MPASEAEIAARPVRRTSLRSVSMPVSRSSSRMPSWATASSIAFCSSAAGNSACCRSGRDCAEHEGPSMRPAISWPMTAGCLMRSMASPSRRPTRISSRICATNSNSDGACGGSAAEARDGHRQQREADGRWPRKTGSRRCHHEACWHRAPGPPVATPYWPNHSVGSGRLGPRRASKVMFFSNRPSHDGTGGGD